MAQDQPMTDDEIEALRDEMDEQREDVRAAIAEEIGGEPEDYQADKRVADGGE